MSFNPGPNEQATEILFSQKISKIDHPDLFFNGSVVKRATEHEHLGLVLTPKLNFENHLVIKMKKAKKIIGIIKHLNRYLPLKSLDQMYKSLVRQHLGYCDFIYHLSASNQFLPGEMALPTLKRNVESVQYQAALDVSGAWKRTSRLKI